MGVTRLSLGVENFDDEILEINGRAHRSPEIYRAYDAARARSASRRSTSTSSPACWARPRRTGATASRRPLALEPDSVTIYQMELPFNTTISRDLLKGTAQFKTRSRAGPPRGAGSRRPSRPWRRAGYHVGSAYTAVKDPAKTRFVYRDRLWQGADLVGTRGGVLRPRQRRPHAEPGHVGDLRRRDEARRDPAQPGLPAHRRGADDSRARAPAEARVDPARLLSREVRRARPRPLQRTVRLAPPDGFLRAADEERWPSRARACSAWTCCFRGSSFPSTRTSVTPEAARPSPYKRAGHAAATKSDRLIRCARLDAAGVVQVSCFFRYMDAGRRTRSGGRRARASRLPRSWVHERDMITLEAFGAWPRALSTVSTSY